MSKSKIFFLTLSIVLIIFVGLSSSSAFELQKTSSANPYPTQEIRNMTWPEKEGALGEKIYIYKGTSQLLRFDRPVIRVAISDPLVCDVTPVGLQEILLYAQNTARADLVNAGNANLIVWDENYATANYEIQSITDIPKLEMLLKNIDSKADIKILPYKDTVAIYGTAETTNAVKEIGDMAKSYDEKSLSFVKVRETKQILLEVKFAEIDRRTAKDYGFDIAGATQFVGFDSFVGQNGPAEDTEEDAFVLRGSPVGRHLFSRTIGEYTFYQDYFGSDELYFQNFMENMIQKNILKIIARPNLLAKDGQEATFMVGGEQPYITTSEDGLEVTFKPFGTMVKFTPEILANERINLKIETEVSELDFSSTASIQGTTIPALVKNTHTTVAELRDNETMVVGGIVFQRINKVDRKVPVLGDLPLLEKIFKKQEYDRRDVELLIVITPHLVNPKPSGENKDFYPAEKVKDAVRPYYASFPDEHGDNLRQMLIQNEPYRRVDKSDKEAADEIERELIKDKKKEEKSIAKEKARTLKEQHAAQRQAARKAAAEAARKKREEAAKQLAIKKEQAKAKKVTPTTTSQKVEKTVEAKKSALDDDSLWEDEPAAPAAATTAPAGNAGTFPAGMATKSPATDDSLIDPTF